MNEEPEDKDEGIFETPSDAEALGLGRILSNFVIPPQLRNDLVSGKRLGKLMASIVRPDQPLASLSTYASAARWGTPDLIAQIAPILENLKRVGFETSTVSNESSKNTAYSEELKSPSDYFEPFEGIIDSFDDLHKAIQKLIQKNPELVLLWRGQQNSSWGLHSSLFRELMKLNGVHPPDQKHRITEPFPTENELVEAERRILDQARSNWRVDGTSALEIFARLQHFGAPTRLIDVSKNPYIAAWFAVESSDSENDKDGRLFAVATQPVLSPDRAQPARELTHIKGVTAQGYDPFWHALESNEDRAILEWGTGSIRRFWVPPLYEQRILAQNGCFIVDGVPMASSGIASYFKKPNESSKYWKKSDLLAAGSIYTKLYNPSRTIKENKRKNFPPTFTFKITAKAKCDIRQVLEDRFAYGNSTIYPDIEGLAQYVRGNLADIVNADSA